MVNNMEEEPEDWSFSSHIGKDLRNVELPNANLKRAVFDNSDMEGLIYLVLTSEMLPFKVQI